MKKTLLLALLCCLFSLGFAGNIVSVNDARTASVNFIKAVYPAMDVNASDIVLKHTELDENGDPVYYQFAIGEQGFILVSANDAVSPILAYSVTNNFDRNVPNYAVGVYRDEIIAAKNTVNVQARKAWDKLLSVANTREVIGQFISDEVEPLVTSKWNQGKYFNYLCPAQPDAVQYQLQSLDCDNHVPTGCVATAMSQVMFYYRYPEYGVGGIGYQPVHYELDAENNPIDTITYPWQVQSFNTLHEFDAMPSTVDFYTGEVSKLIWHAGISVQMGYGPNSSGAQSADALTALKDYWKYNRSAQMYERSDFTTSKWTDSLTKELKALHPIYYSGADADGGHAFVLDGYQVMNDINRTPHYGDTIENIDHIDTIVTHEYDIDTTTFTHIDSVSHILEIDTVLNDTTYYFTYDTTYTFQYDSTITNTIVTYDTSYYYTHTDSLTTYTYDTAYVNTMMHVNWGWGGYSDGYYALNGSGHVGGYTRNEAAMIGVYPADQQPKATSGNKLISATRGSISDGAGNLDYEPGTDRTWTLASNGATRYTFTFTRLNTEADHDVIIFYKNGNLNNEEKRISGTTLPATFSIQADSVTVRFLTDTNDVAGKGFVLEYSVSTGDAYCSEDYVALSGSGTISDKGDSDVPADALYVPDKMCKWKIDNCNTTYFSYPKIELGLGDYVDIYEYKGLQRFELLKRIDIYNWPEEDVFVTHASKIRIHFLTDNYIEGTGFELTYEAITDVKENGISDLNIFPNPASSTMNVLLTTEDAGQLTFRITDMTGRTLSTESVENYGGEMMHTLNVSNLSKGLYLLSIEGKQGSSIHKFIVE